jgi:hypothetical protein
MSYDKFLEILEEMKITVNIEKVESFQTKNVIKNKTLAWLIMNTKFAVCVKNKGF